VFPFLPLRKRGKKLNPATPEGRQMSDSLHTRFYPLRPLRALREKILCLFSRQSRDCLPREMILLSNFTGAFQHSLPESAECNNEEIKSCKILLCPVKCLRGSISPGLILSNEVL
jgi:hypothetical protein